MRTVLLLALAASGVVLGGCGHEGIALAQPAEDGALCKPDVAQREVFIEVKYDKGGLPTVTPETCMVYAQGKITWRGPAKVLTQFQIDFHSTDGAVAAAFKAAGGKGSREMADRQKFTLIAWDKVGPYTYDVSTAKGGTDPTIIIRPN